MKKELTKIKIGKFTAVFVEGGKDRGHLRTLDTCGLEKPTYKETLEFVKNYRAAKMALLEQAPWIVARFLGSPEDRKKNFRFVSWRVYFLPRGINFSEEDRILQGFLGASFEDDVPYLELMDTKASEPRGWQWHETPGSFGDDRSDRDMLVVGV